MKSFIFKIDFMTDGQLVNGHRTQGDLKEPILDNYENKASCINIDNQCEMQSPAATEYNTSEKNNLMKRSAINDDTKTTDDCSGLDLEKFVNLEINDTVPEKECYAEEQQTEKDISYGNSLCVQENDMRDVFNEACNTDDILHSPNISTAVPGTSATDGNTETNTKAEDDDWENLYNENGECINPEIPKKSAERKYIAPPVNCDAYAARFKPMNLEEYSHVLEVSNFPVEFKSQDLIMLFSQYKQSGFDIKWVDDTHALAVFSSSTIAAEVLALRHPFVVLKPLTQASYKSKNKAKKCGSSLDPYRPRPETCVALARRLVTGALGVRLELSAAERETEKRILDRAKERKQLAIKQQREAWGN